MALIQRHILGAINNQVLIVFEVENTTNTLMAILYHNQTDQPAEISVVRPNGQILRRILAAHQDTEFRYDIPPGQQPTLDDVSIRTAWPALGP